MRVATSRIAVAMILAVTAAHADKAHPVDLQTVMAKLSSGSALDETIKTAIAAAGQPNAFDDDVVRWFSMTNATNCQYLFVQADGEYAGDIEAGNVPGPGDHYFTESDREHWNACKNGSTKTVKLPPIPAPGKVDLDGQARAVLELWRDGKFKKIFDDAAPKFREIAGSPQALAHIARLFPPVAGKLVKVGSPMTTTVKDFGRHVTGTAIFEKGTLTFDVWFLIQKGVPRVRDFNLTLPKELRRTPDPADAEQVAHSALTSLLAGKLAAVAALGDIELEQQLTGNKDLAKGFAKLVAKLGKVKSSKVAEQKVCRDTAQCIAYDVVGAKGKLVAHFVMTYALSRWEVAGVQLEPIE